MIKISERAFEELQSGEFLCNYCEASNGYSPNGDNCEGSWCDDAYKAYLDDREITDRIVKIAVKTKVTIERS